MGIATIDKINKMDAGNIYDKLKILEQNGMPIIFKNRIHLCDYLGISSDKCGNQRISEDNFFSAIFNSYKDKHKIIITEIYDDYINRLPHTIKYKELFEFGQKYNTNGIGIYGIYIDDELVYIGSSSSLYDRVRNHCYQMYLKDGYDDSKYIELHKSLIEGRNISFKVIDDNITEENRYEVEYQYIEKYKPVLNTIGTIRQTPYTATLSPKNAKLIKQYKEQIEKCQNKIKLLQEKIDILEKELLK